MSTLDKLRALHMSVCNAWRKLSEPAISEGEAEVLNLGLRLLESMEAETEDHRRFTDCFTDDMRPLLSEYLQRVHSQFDSDADIRITEVPSNE